MSPFPLVAFLAGSFATAHAQSSPVAGERPWGRESMDYWLAREVVAGPALPKEFPAIKIDREEEGAIRAEFPQADYRNAWPGIQVLRADTDGRVVLPEGGGTIFIAAVATAYHSGEGKQNLTPEWRHPVLHEPLDAETMAALGIPEERKSLRGHAPHLGSQVKLVIRQEGVDNLLWANGSLIDSKTLEILSFNGANPRKRDKTAVYDYHGPIWLDGPVSLLLDFAWGEFVEAEGPATPGTTLHLPGAMAGLFALQNGSQRGGSYGYDDPSYVGSRYVEIAAEKPGCVGVCGFLPFWQGEFTDLELIARNGKIAVTTAWSNDYVFAALFNGVRAEDAVTFRVKMRPHVARAIIELPGLPGMPNVIDDLTDRFDLKVPFARFGKLDEMLNYISRAAQISHLGFTDLAEQPGVKTLEFPRVYQDATLREMLRDITEAAGMDVTIDPKNFRATFEKM